MENVIDGFLVIFDGRFIFFIWRGVFLFLVEDRVNVIM